MATLLKAAAEVFSERSYEAATMTEIAARAGASIGSLYQFFPTKELLAKALHEAYLADLSAMLDEMLLEATGRSAVEVADKLFDGLQAFLVERPAFGALVERRDIDKEQKRRTGAAMREKIARLLASAARPVPKERCEAMAAVVLQLMKVAVALNAADDVDWRNATHQELRQMLKNHLNSVQVA